MQQDSSELWAWAIYFLLTKLLIQKKKIKLILKIYLNEARTGNIFVQIEINMHRENYGETISIQILYALAQKRNPNLNE